MPNQRRPNQTLVAFPVDERFLALMDNARGRLSRSAFIRDGLASFLKSKGYAVPSELVDAPDRVGVGGRPKKIVEMPSARVAEEAETYQSKKGKKKP